MSAEAFPREMPNLTGLKKTTDIMAEYMACEWSVPDAAAAMGITYSYANAVVQRVRKFVGDRAV